MKGCPPWRRHRLDVDDRAGDLLPSHDADRLLDEEERRPHVDVEDLVVAFLGRVEDVASVGQRRGVDQHVDPAEPPVRLGDDVAAIGHLGEIRLDEDRRASGRGNLLRHPPAVLGVAPADDEACGPAFGEEPRDRLAEALGAAGHHGDLASEIGRAAIGVARGLGCGMATMGSFSLGSC